MHSITAHAGIASLTRLYYNLRASFHLGALMLSHLYSMRHVQEHAAQLNLTLERYDLSGFDWIAHARGIG